jgi:tRNA nucleotidyltransferase (CCA-adding enzyme)
MYSEQLVMKINEVTEVQDTGIISPDVKTLGELFSRNGFEIRVVGGAVRDVALGKSPKDIDLATDATPQEMQKMFDRAMIKHIPTGIEHGTLTAVLNNEPYEITTLRADTETDGRHAEVKFVKSWEEDAKRRDLTYNAMSMDLSGEIHDYFGGMDDLQNKVSKFVGNPVDRIQEDFLRILRYFRFQGRLATPTWDKETLQAVADNATGLSKISVERVWMEVSKILSGSNVAGIVQQMTKTGVSKTIGLVTNDLNKLVDGGNPIIALAQLGNNADISKRWNMSKPEMILLAFLAENKNNVLDKKKVEDMIADGIDKEKISALAELQGQKKMADHAMITSVPDFPVTGADLIAMGVKPGPDMGKQLNTLKQQWKASNFKATKDQLLGTT